jgi:hypothetical protein
LAGRGAESVLQPCVIGPPRAFADVAKRPQEIPGSRHVIWGDAAAEQLVTADLGIDPSAGRQRPVLSRLVWLSGPTASRGGSPDLLCGFDVRLDLLPDLTARIWRRLPGGSRRVSRAPAARR